MYHLGVTQPFYSNFYEDAVLRKAVPDISVETAKIKQKINFLNLRNQHQNRKSVSNNNSAF